MTPVWFDEGLSFTAVSAGASHTCGVTAAGAAYCWGYNADGELGDGTNIGQPRPVRVTGSAGFTVVSVGQSHSCGVAGAGTLYCWGLNGLGQLGDGTTIIRNVPVRVLGQP